MKTEIQAAVRRSNLKTASRRSRQRRKGAILILAALVMIPVFAFVALSVDFGYVLVMKARLINAADAAALAAAQELHLSEGQSRGLAKNTALEVARANPEGSNNGLLQSDIVFGHWDPLEYSFTASNNLPNAVQITTRRSQLNGNALPLFFAPVIGHSVADVSATAIAAIPSAADPAPFLIDADLLDTDVPSIEDLADLLGVDPEVLLSDGDIPCMSPRNHAACIQRYCKATLISTPAACWHS
jgi:Flp pilus assembly protein TadG